MIEAGDLVRRLLLAGGLVVVLYVYWGEVTVADPRFTNEELRDCAMIAESEESDG